MASRALPSRTPPLLTHEFRRCSNRPSRYLLSGRGLAQPVVETGLTPNRVFFGDERPFGQHRAEVEGLRIGHCLARVVPRGEEMSDHFVKAELLGAADFDDAVDRSTDGGPRYGGGDIVRGDGLEQHWCQADGIAVGRGVRDVLDELEELRRVNDRVWDRRSLDQRFLSDFRSEVSALRQAVGAHDRKGNVMPNACRLFLRLEVARRGLKEIQRGSVLERGTIRYINHDGSAIHRRGNSFARDGVDPSAW